MYCVGDIVKVIPDSYINLAKHDFNQRHAWNTPDIVHDNDIMLGGAYSVLETIEKNYDSFYRLLRRDAKRNKTSGAFLQLDNATAPCPFSLGDELIFNPKCSHSDMEYLAAALGRSDYWPKGRHKVTGLLNGYYIFIDVPMADPWAFPFRWIDFGPVR